MKYVETGEMAQRLRALTVLLEGLGWAPSIHTVGLSSRLEHGKHRPERGKHGTVRFLPFLPFPCPLLRNH